MIHDAMHHNIRINSGSTAFKNVVWPWKSKIATNMHGMPVLNVTGNLVSTVKHVKRYHLRINAKSQFKFQQTFKIQKLMNEYNWNLSILRLTVKRVNTHLFFVTYFQILSLL